jgi:Protein of unknown function (DUF2490)
VFKLTRIIYGWLALSILLATGESNAQSEEIDFQTWTDFTFTYLIKNRTNIGADFGVRGMVSKNDWNQIYFRPTYQYYFNRTIQAAGGVAIFATFSDVIKNTTEFRIFQEVSVAWPSFEYIKFYHRLRFEQRFFTYQNGSLLGNDLPNKFESRARYQLSAESLDIRLGNKNQPIYFLVAWELFYALNEEAVELFINNQRIIGGVGQRLSPNFRYEIQYIFQQSRRFSDEGLRTTEHLLRLRLFLMLRTKEEA